MNETDLKNGVGPACKKLNPQVFGPTAADMDIAMTGKELTVYGCDKPKKRLRQSSKPVLNGLETAWRNVLRATLPGTAIREQARRYKLGNNVWYKPDLTAIVAGHETAWECKGPKEMKGVAKGTMTIKVAAHLWPEVRWILVWKDNSQWQTQEVKG